MPNAANPIANLIGRVASQLMLDNPDAVLDPPPAIQDSVEQAKHEWLQARAFFDHVTDPELVDYAIYQIKAAERRYMYLLDQARGDQPPLPPAP